MSAYDKKSVEGHQAHKGKLGVHSKVPLDSRDDLSTWYTPGVAAPCREIAEDSNKAYEYTRKSNSVAVVSDGSAVLGLGNIGGVAGLPVMEGKAILMKQFADIDAVPLVLSTQDPEKIIEIVEGIAPTFGAVNLEDIKAPECFYIEEQLQDRLSIPVFHDDQHGTAIVVLAGLINACKVEQKELSSLRVCIAGAGAAGIATANLLAAAGIEDICMTDSRGVLISGREGMNEYKEKVATYNIRRISGGLEEGIQDTDVFIGVSKPNIVTQEMVQSMNDRPFIFALSNPDPEIIRDEALVAGAAIYASGRSDVPNQINNLLAFPGLLRGVLDARIPNITMEHKLAAAYALADYVISPSHESIVPDPLDKKVAEVVATAVKSV